MAKDTPTKDNTLDEIILNDIGKHCPHPFMLLHHCMSLPDPDPAQCLQPRLLLAACIKKHVPSVQKVEAQCAGLLRDYHDCLKLHDNDSRKCARNIAGLRDCALLCL